MKNKKFHELYDGLEELHNKCDAYLLRIMELEALEKSLNKLIKLKDERIDIMQDMINRLESELDI